MSGVFNIFFWGSGWWCWSPDVCPTSWFDSDTSHPQLSARHCFLSADGKHLIITCFSAVLSVASSSTPRCQSKFKKRLVFGTNYAEIKHLFCNQSCEIMSHSLLKVPELVQHCKKIERKAVKSSVSRYGLIWFNRLCVASYLASSLNMQCGLIQAIVVWIKL